MRPFPDTFVDGMGYKVPDSVSHTTHVAGYHTGVDFRVPLGTPVHCPHKGVVVTSSYDDTGYGHYVVVEGTTRSGKRRWLLAHMSRRDVTVGEAVKRGDVLGLSGETGNVTGPHCHGEQRHDPFGYWDHEDPTVLLRPYVS